MYLARTTPLARLRAYERELTDLYLEALRLRDLGAARRLYGLRWRVRRAIRLREEWGDAPIPSWMARVA
ncbi:MAG TPA: hypothetical protein VKY56_00865 [Chloroflexota bacterium]|jgi:hypothetical protein|nr:hypothetical protein [Chloroflexota bacterium]